MKASTRKNKIIFIARMGRKYNVGDTNDPNEDLFYYHWGYHYSAGLMGKLDDLEFEIWKHDINVDKVYKKKIANLFYGRVFPTHYLIKSKDIDFSWLLVRDLLHEVKQNNIVIFFSGLHRPFWNFISILFWYIPQVNVQVGGSNPMWKFKKSKRIRSLIYNVFNRMAIRNHDYVFARNKTEGDYLGSTLKSEQIIWHPIRQIIFEQFPIIDRAQVRKHLGWPVNKKIVIVVGRAVYNVGAKTIIDLYIDIIKAGYHLIWVGLGSGDKELLEQIKILKIPTTPPVQFKDIHLYYNAADVYIYPSFDEETLNFGGTGYKSLESLCCGTPVVSTTMKAFPGEIDNSVCKIPSTPIEIIPEINSIFKNYPDRKKCRTMIEKYYQPERIRAVQLAIYKKLFTRYYNEAVGHMR